MEQQKLIARKRLTYNHRKLAAGDEFYAPALHALLLVAQNKARSAPPPVTAYGQGGYFSGKSRMTDLREQAGALGIEIDGRWGERRLAAEIELARSARR